MASRNPVGARNHVAFQCLASVDVIDRTFVQQSSSYRSQVLKTEHTCRCLPVTLVREPFSSQFLFSQRVRSMKSVSLTMLKAEKAGLWQTPETLCWQEPWLLMLLCDGFQEICRYQESCCLFQFGAKQSRALNNFCLVQCLASVTT